MLKAIVFDFDGVLVDSEPLHYRAALRVLEPMRITFSYKHYLEYYVGFDDRDLFRTVLRDFATTKWSESDMVRLCAQKGDAFVAVVEEGIQAIPGVKTLIDNAPAGFPMAIASGATRRDIDAVLGRLELIGRFDPIITADVVKRSKPDPQTYAMAVAQLASRWSTPGISPSECLAVEDTAAGIEAARGAGLWTLGLTTTSDKAHLSRAHRVVANLEGLTVQQLQEWFG